MSEEREILQRHKLRATSARMALLSHLRKQKNPLSAEEIRKDMKMDLVTVYRNLQSFEEVKLIREMRFLGSTLYYEYVESDRHHHHLVCTECGVISELAHCNINDLSKKVLQQSNEFAMINSHSLEFFGVCKECVPH